MDKNILVKYDIEGDFVENHFYDIKFDYNRCSNVITLENTPLESDNFLKEIHNRSVSMQYRGISRIDGLKIFILNTLRTRIEYKLNEILK
jgi:hypothetical protein